MRRDNIALTGIADLTATANSSQINLQHILGFCIQVVWSGGTSPVGSIKIQASCDNLTQSGGIIPAAVTNWTDIGGTDTALSGNSGTILINLENVYFDFARVVYTRTSGTATTCAIRVVCKGV